ncbi:DUF3139 domain-containing protein [Paenibacillus sp. NEAU-GSW1]|uniref:DUF3139 domain-containing protein n=1 Tax=Paenibacillus sp. NEAU-GSW1 TaxID=2682486 RepID=UPI0012E0EB01|nr:DUF3139 domain-containing protein [Paenibacillus sp. NEAU-GSW1]MUT64350.1 DUF3139 domain-containing protein [Paenibacillus sp. NEAU-GSW1]
MKKMTIIMSVCLLILAIIAISLYIGIIKPPIDSKAVEQDVVKHLHSKGISQEKYDLEISYRWDSKLLGYNPYIIKVVFKDEPDVSYHYTYHYKSQIKEVTQSGVAPMNNREDKNFKHTE